MSLPKGLFDFTPRPLLSGIGPRVLRTGPGPCRQLTEMLQPIGGNGSERFLKRRRRLAKREIATFATLSDYLFAVYEKPAKVSLFVKYYWCPVNLYGRP